MEQTNERKIEKEQKKMIEGRIERNEWTDGPRIETRWKQELGNERIVPKDKVNARG